MLTFNNIMRGRALVYLKMVKMKFYRIAAEDSVPSFKVGGSWRFRKIEIDNWIKTQEIAGAQSV
jgi:excisionase family DNA binding protein